MTDGAQARVRGANGKFVRTVDQAEQDAEAGRLRGRGLSYPQIAAQLGISKQSAQRAVARTLAATVTEAAAEVRHLELDRLDHLYQQALGVLEREHLTVSHGKVIYIAGDGDTEVPLIDDAPVLQAIDRIIRIMERRAKLLGLDAPKKVEVITLDWIDAQIAQLSAEVDQRAGELAAADAGEAARAEGATHP